jgi:hypothetical protein
VEQRFSMRFASHGPPAVLDGSDAPLAFLARLYGMEARTLTHGDLPLG